MSNLHPYQISFFTRPYCSDRTSAECIVVTRFAESMDAAIRNWETDQDVNRDWPRQYGRRFLPAGRDASAVVHGVIQDGRVFAKHFYYHGRETGPQSIPLAFCSDVVMY